MKISGVARMRSLPRLSTRPRLVTLLRLSSLGLVGAVALSGCGTQQTTVVSAFYPLQFVAQQVVGDKASVSDLTPAGQEPHDLQLSVPQTVDLAKAKVVFYERGFQPSIDSSVANDAQGDAVDASKYVGLRRSNDPEEPGLDPHIWLDPVLLSKVVTGFTDAMVKVQPADAPLFRAHARRLKEQLAQLDHDYRTGLRSCQRRTLVVSHDAFEYLGRRYNLKVLPIAGLSPDAEPSPRHLAQLRTLAEKDGVTTIFTETLASPKLADTLAGELGIRTAVLDPLEGMLPGSGKNYFSVMRANLREIQKADGCS